MSKGASCAWCERTDERVKSERVLNSVFEESVLNSSFEKRNLPILLPLSARLQFKVNHSLAHRTK